MYELLCWLKNNKMFLKPKSIFLLMLNVCTYANTLNIKNIYTSLLIVFIPIY